MSTRSFDTMINPSIEDLLAQVDSKFALVTLAARRARGLTHYYNTQNVDLAKVSIPPQVATTVRKELSKAFEEIAAKKIRWVEPSEVAEDAADDTADA